MKPAIKLVVADAAYSAGLVLEGYSEVRSVLAELHGIACDGSASLFLEAAASLCLRSGRSFRCSDPLLDRGASCRDIVEVEIDARLPGILFVRLHRIEADGRCVRTHTGTLGGVSAALGIVPCRTLAA